MPRSPGTMTVAISRFARAAWRSEIHLVIAGETLFVTGWSLLWASALHLIPFMPVRACPLLMVLGLAFAAYAMRRPHRHGRVHRTRSSGRRLSQSMRRRADALIHEQPANYLERKS